MIFRSTYFLTGSNSISPALARPPKRNTASGLENTTASAIPAASFSAVNPLLQEPGCLLKQLLQLSFDVSSEGAIPLRILSSLLSLRRNNTVFTSPVADA